MQVFKFNDEIHHYQSFVKANIKLLGNLIIISEQLLLKNKHRHYIDILAYDLDENRLVILELKNVMAGDAIVGQSIRYYDHIRRSNPDSLYQLLRQRGINTDNINLDPKVILVAPDFSDQLSSSIDYIDSINIDIIKLNLINNNGYYEIIKENFKPIIGDIVVGSKTFKQWDFEEYKKEGVNSLKLSLAKQFINYVRSRKNINVYFYDKKITLMENKKVWANILIKQQPNSDYLDVAMNNKNYSIDTSIMGYQGDIIKYKVLSDSVKITFSKVPTSFLSNIM